MVYTLRSYLVAAALVASVALQTPQVSATSLNYDPYTTSGTTDKISKRFPGYGGEIADEDCAYTVQTDPALLDISTIPQSTVVYSDLLTNSSTPPTEPVFTKVGTATLSKDLPSGTQPSQKPQGQRRLEFHTNEEIAQLEEYFNITIETTLANLPTEGEYSPTPWPGPNWVTYNDSINYVWSEGQPSPAEKYARAFGLNVTEFMDAVSAEYGVDSRSDGSVCTTDADCDFPATTEKYKCGIRSGQSSGYCVLSWTGICHAWAPAAIIEDEPQCAVTYNNVTFQPMDLKALLSVVYDSGGVEFVFTGARYAKGNDSIDQYGRHTNEAYRDLNPAYFHIATANLLGNLNSTFVGDIDAGTEVWNHPIRAFKVHEQTAMSLTEAARTFYGLEEYPWNADAKSIVYMKTYLSWADLTFEDGPLVSSGRVDQYTASAYYHYLLEMDDAGKIIGGEWLYDSNDKHLDFLWVPAGGPAFDTVTSVGLSYQDVRILQKEAAACTQLVKMGVE
ncbi:hypothetical protein PHYBOEH_007037 [Phytophthora boehmeriae]|uniref:Transglutaminase elicitor n=1 Tax=Phytophthora boehmeriae TaxID=109152 RepID=A0A8T1WA49_9STRA|nr:hypothetical protein PHYBOEH_007037 [Phytophthora boehmeriae]